MNSVTEIIADQPLCGRLRTAATEHNKHKSTRSSDKTEGCQRNCSAAWGGVPCGPGDGGDFGTSENLSRCVPRLLTGTEEHKTAGNCSPINPIT
jgi:hypothetical protein